MLFQDTAINLYIYIYKQHESSAGTLSVLLETFLSVPLTFHTTSSSVFSRSFRHWTRYNELLTASLNGLYINHFYRNAC
jgi:hypothetical protein